MNHSHLTTEATIAPDAPSELGFKTLKVTAGEDYVGDRPGPNVKTLATILHSSDWHICDAESPARQEYLDRYFDPNSAYRAILGYVGTYRPWEILTTQVAAAFIETLNRIEVGPISKRPVDALVITGDATDNGQLNELEWYLNLLDGQEVDPSGGRSASDWVGSDSDWDERYWHPEGDVGGRVDLPTGHFGYPNVPGLISAARKPFKTTGLRHPWLSVHGNHDALLQGTAATTPELDALAQGSEKLAALKNMADLADLFSGFGEVGPAVYPGLDHMDTNEVTADPRRALVKMQDWVNVHTNCGHDHGLDAEQPETPYWYRNIGNQVRLIALDTVNRFGGWQGCLHREQFDWLSHMLDESKDKYIVLTSHHPLENLFNGYVPEDESAPALEEEVRRLLEKHPNVVLWFSGHVHDHKITQSKNSDGSHAFWEIRTGSHIDWPQQSRVIEIVKTTNGKIAIGTVVFDHAGPVVFNGTPDELADPVALAGRSRLLAANDWQRQNGGPFALELMEGLPEDRNIWLWANDPLN